VRSSRLFLFQSLMHAMVIDCQRRCSSIRLFGAPYVERLRAMGFDNVHEVNFGAPSPDREQARLCGTR
jgi:hypothetical protein